VRGRQDDWIPAFAGMRRWANLVLVQLKETGGDSFGRMRDELQTN